MYWMHAPQIVDFEIFSAMPDHLRRKGVRSIWADANRGGHPVDSFLEGPVFDDLGNLYVSDIPFGRIFRIDPQGAWRQIAEYDGEPNGMKFLNSRELLITDYKNGLMVCDVASGSVRSWLERRNTERFKGVNDLTFDSHGNLYFTDQGQTGLHDPTGRVYRLGGDGRLDLLLGNVPSPNGVVLSPDEKVLYVAATRGNCVWRVPLLPDGSVAKVGQFFTSYGPSGPDGLAMDSAGRLIIANPGLGIVWVLNSRAEPVRVLRATQSSANRDALGPSTTNIAYGGPNRSTLYCTDSTNGVILRSEMDVAGCTLHRGKH